MPKTPTPMESSLHRSPEQAARIQYESIIFFLHTGSFSIIEGGNGMHLFSFCYYSRSSSVLFLVWFLRKCLCSALDRRPASQKQKRDSKPGHLGGGGSEFRPSRSPVPAPRRSDLGSEFRPSAIHTSVTYDAEDCALPLGHQPHHQRHRHRPRYQEHSHFLLFCFAFAFTISYQGILRTSLDHTVSSTT
jgi:hypothetical protein